MGENLESKLEFSRWELDLSRRELNHAGLILHFAGEIVGAIVCTGYKGIMEPLLKNWNSDPVPEVNWGYVGLGVGIYVATQIPAFYLKFISLTQEENQNLAGKHLGHVAEEMNKGHHFRSWLDLKWGTLHNYYANPPELVEDRVKRYALMRRKVPC